MAGFGYKYLAFLMVFHVLMYQAASGGYIEQQSPDSPHKKFVDQFSDDNITETAQVSGSSGIIQDTFSPIVALSEFLNTVIGVLVSPYSSIQGTGLPPTLKMLLQGLIGLSEAYVAYLFVRGGA